MVWILVDLAILAIIGLCIFLGYKRGLIGVAFKIVSFFLAILIAFILFKPVSNLIINNTGLGDKIKAVVVEKVKIEDDAAQKEENKGSTNISGYIQDSIKNATVETANNAIAAAAEQITVTIINVIVFIIVFVLAKLILLLTKGILKFIAELPIIKQFDKLGGFIYGTLQGLLIVYCVLLVIALVSVSNTVGIVEVINKSILGRIMYNNNLILMIFFRPKY